MISRSLSDCSCCSLLQDPDQWLAAASPPFVQRRVSPPAPFHFNSGITRFPLGFLKNPCEIQACWVPVFGLNIRAEAYEHAGDEVQALRGGDVKRRPPVVVLAVGVDAEPEQAIQQVDPAAGDHPAQVPSGIL